MKKTICIYQFTFLLISIILFGCTQPQTINNIQQKTINSLGKFPYNSILDELVVVEIDNCEYIVCNAYANKDITITHKGNCKFCNERNKKNVTKNNN